MSKERQKRMEELKKAMSENKSEVRKCPKCGREMERGYVPLIEGVRWRTQDNSRGDLLMWGGVVWPKKLEGCLCRNCRLLLLNY